MTFPETRVVPLVEIKKKIDKKGVFGAVRKAFVAHAQGKVNSPLPGHLLFQGPPGDCHLKYGYLKGSDYFIIKIANGFYDNGNLGLPVNTGVNLVFSQETGALLYILQDEGWLTSWRTAAAGALAANFLAPKELEAVAMIGTGHQAYLQLDWFSALNPCRKVNLWGRSRAKAATLAKKLSDIGYECNVCDQAGKAASQSQVIWTTTASDRALIEAGHVRPGTTIVALGADNPGKQEIDPAIVGKAALVVADDWRQCATFGEINHALKENLIKEQDIRLLGDIFSRDIRPAKGDIAVCDLTGIVAQDIAISESVIQNLTG